jgi:hypothetical protein
MYLAAKTTATPVEIWAIVIVAVICLAFWLVMVVGFAPRPDPRKRERSQLTGIPVVGGVEVPVAGGVHVAAGGRSVAPSRDAPATEIPHVPQPRDAEAPAPAGTRETRDDLPPVPGQRGSATDEAARSRWPGR